jgi:hypothetical protein
MVVEPMSPGSLSVTSGEAGIVGQRFPVRSSSPRRVLIGDGSFREDLRAGRWSGRFDVDLVGPVAGKGQVPRKIGLIRSSPAGGSHGEIRVVEDEQVPLAVPPRSATPPRQTSLPVWMGRPSLCAINRPCASVMKQEKSSFAENRAPRGRIILTISSSHVSLCCKMFQ